MKFITTLILGFTLTFCSFQESLLEQVKASGNLYMVTRISPTTYYDGPKGATGLEYDLAKRFAEELGVELNITVADDLLDILSMVSNRQVHFAAAGLTVNSGRKASVRFSPHYQNITQQIVYRQDSLPPPSQLAEFKENNLLYVVAGSHQVDLLKRLQKEYPHLVYEEVGDIESSELLEQVWEGAIKYAVVNSSEAARMRHFYPELRVGFEFPGEKGEIGWAFPRFGGDSSLYIASIQFFNQMRQSGELEQLIERYYGHLDTTDSGEVNARIFYRHVEERLPKYQEYFKRVAAQYHLDWRLVAAIGYQESHWNSKAVSATGVRGVMMLTKLTAQEMGVDDREDPLQSIKGGTKYFTMIKERISPNIPEPDRTWFALAAYNVGFGHFIDARNLTKKRGGNDERWVDVKKNLPLLANPSWCTKTKHGCARGYEPVEFVKNIRRFYDMLVRFEIKSIEVNRNSPLSLPFSLKIADG